MLLDVANPLDFSAGFPPTLTVKDTDSLAEQIQRAHPEARVVKSLNTVTASVMVHPGRTAGDQHDVRRRRRPARAGRSSVSCSATSGGATSSSSRPCDAARGLEMWLPLWVRLMGALGTAEFNLRLVR